MINILEEKMALIEREGVGNKWKISANIKKMKYVIIHYVYVEAVIFINLYLMNLKIIEVKRESRIF